MKIFLFMAALAASLSLRLPALCADPSLSVASLQAAPGATVPLPITLSADAQNVSGFEVHLSTAAVTPAGGPALAVADLDVKALPNALSDAAFDFNTVNGEFIVAMVHPDPVNGPLTLLNLQVHVPANAAPGATYALNLTAKLNDPDGKPITVQTQGGTLTVAGGSVTPLKGDVNGDGKVNVSDATLALQFSVGLLTPTAAQFAAADLNGDGSVKVNDVTRLLQAAVGLITL